MLNKFMWPLLFCFSIISTSGFAGNEDIRQFETEEQRHRYKQLTEELRCLVCQNQNLADSDAGLATDLRDELYRMIRENKSDDEITEFMAQRYGDFVFYDPPIKKTTILLWFGPFILIGLATLFLVVYLLRRSDQSPGTPLSEEEKNKLNTLLNKNNE